MDAFEFFQMLGTMCKERGAECVGCEMRLFCYTPACAVTDELVELVISLLAREKDRTENPDHSCRHNGGPHRPCPCKMDMSTAPGYELRQ